MSINTKQHAKFSKYKWLDFARRHIMHGIARVAAIDLFPLIISVFDSACKGCHQRTELASLL